MGLADIKGEACFDVFADIMGPMMNIAADKETAQFFKPHEVPEGEDPDVFKANIMKEYLPKLLKDHKQDFIAILASLDGKTPAQYTKGLTVPQLFQNVMAVFSDPMFRSFLA